MSITVIYNAMSRTVL